MGRLSSCFNFSLNYGSMTIVQWTVVGAFTPLTVSVLSHPVAVVALDVPLALSQVIDVADVTPEPPSLKLTWMFDSGESVNEKFVPLNVVSGTGLRSPRPSGSAGSDPSRNRSERSSP